MSLAVLHSLAKGAVLSSFHHCVLYYLQRGSANLDGAGNLVSMMAEHRCSMVSRLEKASNHNSTGGFSALQVKDGVMPNTDHDDTFEDKKPRQHDTYLDRRSGDDRREKHSLNYFDDGGPERRTHRERRDNLERRAGYTRIGPWTSVGPIPDADSNAEHAEPDNDS